MKITILTQYYPPETGAPQARLLHLVESLAVRGHSISILTAMPNYPKGEIYPGYGGMVLQKLHKGTHVIHCFIYPTKEASFWRRMANYFTFVCSSALFGTLNLEKQNAIFVESPPLFLGLSAIWLGWRKNAKVIFNVSDLWPETALHLGLIRVNSLSYYLSTYLEQSFYRLAWLVTGQSISIIKNIQDRFPSILTLLFSNGSDCSKFDPRKKSNNARLTLGPKSDCVILYAGLHGLAQGLNQAIEAAEYLSENQRIRFVFIGDGPEKSALISQATLKNLANVHFLPTYSADMIPEILASADILLVSLKTHIPGAVPSKLYEGMASGKPILLVATGEPADIVLDNNAGLVVSPGDIKELVNAINTLVSQPDLQKRLGENGRQAALKYYDRRVISNNFIHFLEKAFPIHEGPIASTGSLICKTGLPSVSIIVPCRNEIKYIEKFLEALLKQQTAGDITDIIIADGLSSDGTKQVLDKYSLEEPRIRVIENPKKIVSAGLNAAIRLARGQAIIRMDVHTYYPTNYVQSCLEVLNETGADNVGGPALTLGENLIQQSIGSASHSGFALGGARFRRTGYEGLADTVPYGCWFREVLHSIGPFDERLVRNQDDELNLRICRLGGKIWQSSKIKSWYYPRASFASLFKQYFKYGYWKIAIIKKHRRPGSIRQLIPSLFISVLLILGISSLWSFHALWVLSGLVFSYILLNIMASFHAASLSKWKLLLVLPLVFACYHFSYGFGFLFGLWNFFIVAPKSKSQP